jgi:hypothetical protein
MAWGRSNGLDTKDGVVLALILIVISAAISIFNSFFYSSQFLKHRAGEVGALFEDRRNFSQIAKEVLNTRPDVAYLKLFDENRILKESFGGGSEKDIKEFRLDIADKHTIMIGLRETKNKDLILRSLLWSMLIGGGIGGICTLIVFLTSSDQSVYYERLITAMKRVSRGDLTPKLDIESIQSNSAMTRVYESFNQMVDQLRKREEVVKESSEFGPTLVFSDKKEETNLRKVIAFVAKISNFEELSRKLEPGDLTSFLTEYRKAASTIISDYGGITEALLQDEIVALFNVPDEQEKPELRAVCAAVEVLQVLSSMNRQRKIEGKDSISGKIGIDEKYLPFYSDSDIPQNVKEVITLAREICEEAPLWKVLVSKGLYSSISDYVEAKELGLSNKTFFSIVAVEEGIIQV